MPELDPLSMSIIVKAVDFLFDQAGSIIQDLRQSKNKSEELSTDNRFKVSKNEVLEAMSDDINVREIQHCLDQVQIYVKNVHAFERHIAIYGGEALAPIEYVNKLEISRGELRKTIQKLKYLLEASSQKRINIMGLE